MKTSEMKQEFSWAKRALRAVTYRIMVGRMVADNIADLIPKGWEMQHNNYYLSFAPAEGSGITAADLDKLGAKLARAFNCEPKKTITADVIDFTWWVYPTFMNKWDWKESVMIEFKIGNTEKCDFIVKRKMQKISEPTGYCKALAEKKYLEPAKN